MSFPGIARVSLTGFVRFPILTGFEDSTLAHRGHLYQELTNRLREALAGHIREKYGVELAIVLERPPRIEMGEAASPVCFELAKRLKRAPRQIAQEIANGLGKVEGFATVEVAGGGYLNAYFDRRGFWEALRQAEAKGPAGMPALRTE